MIFRYPFVAMGSGCELLLDMDGINPARAAAQSVLRGIARLENKYSFFRPESYLGQLNANAFSGAVALDRETAHLLNMAGGLHQDTGGLYDPTIGSLQGCWDFRAMTLPDPEQLERRRAGIGWANVERCAESIRFHHPATRLDMGGLVKEYALDGAVAALTALGVRRGLVNLGGDLRVVGRISSAGRPFRVGVAHPRRHHDTLATLALGEGAVVTSGDYQRYFLRDGRRYHHLLDPRTGYPLDTRFSGVTAHGATALEALRACKRMFLSERTAPGEIPAGAHIACDLTGSVVQWGESPHCAVLALREEMNPALAPKAGAA